MVPCVHHNLAADEFFILLAKIISVADTATSAEYRAGYGRRPAQWGKDGVVPVAICDG